MHRYLVLLFALLSSAASAQDRAGDFDYYVLSLSWSPSWCALEGDSRASPQCDDEADFGWVLHGLWPQNERGYPHDCRSTFAAPSRSDTSAMADIMGTSGAAWHQWNKHGVCSGLDSQDFYRLARVAYAQITRPPVFRRLQDSVTLPASVVEDAFLQANPGMEPDQITITCRDGYIQEARICLTRGLELRDCGADVIRDCSMSDALLDPVR
ncbi:MAG: ribonuclease T2 [Rhodobacteraceae bacterium]|nr:ribonuclease T2 [Paracoccaceae bacterium]